MQTLARWCFRHRWIVLTLWLVALVGVRAVDLATGTAYSDDFGAPHTDSSRVQRLLEAASPAAAGDTSRIVFAVGSGTLADPAGRARVEATVASVAPLPHVASVTSPFDPRARGQLSEDGRVGYATLQFDEASADLPADDVKRVVDTARSHRGGGIQVELGGAAISQQEPPSLGGVGFGLIAAAVVLLLAFGSIVAMGIRSRRRSSRSERVWGSSTFSRTRWRCRRSRPSSPA